MWTQPRSHNLKIMQVKKKKNIYLVQSACEIDDDFSGSVIVNDLKLTNVTWAAKEKQAMKPKCSPVWRRSPGPELLHLHCPFGQQLLTVLHHDSEEAHNNLGAGPDQDLAFPTLLSIVDAFKSICENVHAHHDACKTRHVQASQHREEWSH